MYFKATFRNNPKTNKSDWYYRLVESYRNALDEVRQRTMLSVGFLDDLSGDQIDQVQHGINDCLIGQTRLLNDSMVNNYVDCLYQRLIKEKKIDLVTKSSNKDFQTIDLNTIKNKKIREVGAEWISLQAAKQIRIDRYLENRAWTPEEISLAMSHIVSRAIYPASELKTVLFMQENSSICELTGYDANQLTKDRLYQISKKLYAEKEGLEKYLSSTTNELFDLHDNIILYDLTNTYFEGEKRNSRLARYGRSKEKRSDCPLVVLAMVVNVEGFVKYSSIYQGNMSDSKTLCDMIDRLRLATSSSSAKATVVIDAGIATEENLQLILSKGYDYVCVRRSNLKNYKQVSGGSIVRVRDKKNREIELERVLSSTNDMAYYLKVTSPGKGLKEKAMKSQFQQRFEDGLERIAQSLSKKSGIKRFDKVCERVGRLKQKYPSIHRIYQIDIKKDTNEICTHIVWKQSPHLAKEKEERCGVYFLRTNLQENGEELTWKIYNCIRNIESSFRILKTDLDLRPIFHKSDEATQAHLHLGLLAYWIVNTLRHQLRQHGIKSEWREVVRVMNTQKCVTTTMQNIRNQWIVLRRCSEPEEKAQQIYDALQYKYAPFIRKKFVVPKQVFKNQETTQNKIVIRI
ncbi:MAG: IS1634 family transposase [Bacteroidales bacterium]|nr:IS1634 family transposase [Bacteroidales bacterium]MDZ4203668.1 IS1634 family transposase [Bacteroidales bacterium]